MEQRWVAQFSSVDYNIKYRSGKSNVNTDVLSRCTANPLPTDNCLEEEVGTAVASVTSAVELAPVGEDFVRGEWEEAQTADLT